MKRIIIAICMLTLFTVKAQQEPQYTQYMYNMSIVNPAYAGFEDVLSIGFLGRKQWVGVKGAPETYTAFIHGKVDEDLGLGFSLINDKMGPVNETFANIDFSYRINLTESIKLGLGIKGGVIFQNIGLVDLNQADDRDVVFSSNKNKGYPAMGVGMLAYNERFYLSISVPNFIRTLHFKQDYEKEISSAEEIHTYIGAGYVVDVHKKLKVKPSFLCKYAIGTPVAFDTSLNMLWNEKVEFGVSYRLDDALSFLTNFKITHTLRIGYAYDHTLSNINDYSSGSHEIMVLFDFFSNKKKRYVRFY
ncbi:type IX secretion system membrane protein PorP/SprF [Tenacibaculum sp. IB213877]|uniref:PorP/SprF family type IX secretion system membrane protein n=1 Tax=Tenacibaculum sp. IB213877 TaxID=3097351 RepID=UPI002A5AF091|nr:type IX secretion system membrane protein PorP/SprF [Tenacibaculum sp. IB213877]MDY0781497.1 type IX secretion system membrane protein PorP/SprF [Tenacibaculum sp. IB213877]